MFAAYLPSFGIQKVGFNGRSADLIIQELQVNKARGIGMGLATNKELIRYQK